MEKSGISAMIWSVMRIFDLIVPPPALKAVQFLAGTREIFRRDRYHVNAKRGKACIFPPAEAAVFSDSERKQRSLNEAENRIPGRVFPPGEKRRFLHDTGYGP